MMGERIFLWLAGGLLGFSVVCLVWVMSLPPVEERLVDYSVTMRDGSIAKAQGVDGYQTTRAGALCFVGRDRELSVCFAPGEWTKVEVAQ